MRRDAWCAALIGVASVLLACGASKPVPAAPEGPAWVRALIEELGALPPGRPPRAIYRYEYQGQIVYYLPPQCCDAPGAFCDADGRYLCAPDGGFLGIGDGHCSDFTAVRTGEHLVWREVR